MQTRPQGKPKGLGKSEGVKCGRRWSDTQLQRKRQLDREAQRVAREKTKYRISHLEALIKSFQENEGDRIRKLLEKIDEQQAEIQKLRDVIRGINRVIEGSNIGFGGSENSIKSQAPAKEDLLPPDTDQQDASGVPPEVMSKNVATLSAQEVTIASPLAQETITLSPPAQETTIWLPALPMDESVVLEDIISPIAPKCEPRQQDQTIAKLAASIADNYGLDGRLWYLAGGVLSYLLQARDVDTPVETCDDEDIAIRAVFQGWSAVTKKYQLDRGWQWLKELDERIYYHLPAHDRLVHIRNVRMIYANQVNPGRQHKDGIPPFFRSRPCQEYVQFDPLIEHFPWPGFRERLLFWPRKYATNKFMDTLRMCVDFTWNQDAHEMYVYNPIDERYRYSDSLIQRTMDIRCYAARREFFDVFPELRADIPCSAIPLHSLFPATPVQSGRAEIEMFVNESEEEEEDSVRSYDSGCVL